MLNVEWYKPFKVSNQKGTLRALAGQEKLDVVQAEKQLWRGDTMNLVIVHGQPTNSMTYIQTHHTPQIQEVVIALTFCMQP